VSSNDVFSWVFVSPSKPPSFPVRGSGLKRWQDDRFKNGSDHALVELFADAWSIVDNARRLHRLLWKMPGLETESISRKFVDQWSTLKSIRDAMQHPDKDYADGRCLGPYVYGTLCWIDSRHRKTQGKVFAHVLNAGPQSDTKVDRDKFPSEIPVDTLDHVHSITLRVGQTVVNLSDLLTDIDEATAKLEQIITAEVTTAIEHQKKLYPERSSKLEMKVKADLGLRLELSNLKAEAPAGNEQKVVE
jgi:hypothetical protein